jgi:hypothetical protein
MFTTAKIQPCTSDSRGVQTIPQIDKSLLKSEMIQYFAATGETLKK